jgi:tetratricopeptide (TPR) repeat protein
MLFGVFLFIQAQVLAKEETPALVKAEPSSPEASVNLQLKGGIAKWRSGDEAGAEKIFEEIVSKDKGNADAYYNLGVIAERNGNLDLALKYYRKAHQVNPDDRQIELAESQVQAGLANQRARLFSERTVPRMPGFNQVDMNEMPPKAPPVAVSAQFARTHFAITPPQKTQAFHVPATPLLASQAQADPQRTKTLGRKSKQLLRVAAGVAATAAAAYFHVDTCSLCGGMLHR